MEAAEEPKNEDMEVDEPEDKNEVVEEVGGVVEEAASKDEEKVEEGNAEEEPDVTPDDDMGDKAKDIDVDDPES